MFKLRSSIAVLCVLSALICAVWALPKSVLEKCDDAYATCKDACPGGGSFTANKCYRDCGIARDACYKKAGTRPPGAGSLLVPTTELQPTSSPAPSPKRVVPQGTLTQASPSPSPNKI